MSFKEKLAIAKANAKWAERDGSKSPKARKQTSVTTNFSRIFPLAERNKSVEGEAKTKIRGISAPLDY